MRDAIELRYYHGSPITIRYSKAQNLVKLEIGKLEIGLQVSNRGHHVGDPLRILLLLFGITESRIKDTSLVRTANAENLHSSLGNQTSKEGLESRV